MPMAFKKNKKYYDSDMIALHPGSSVFVKKDDLVNIYTDKYPLYTARLTGLVFGDELLQKSRMPEEKIADSSLQPLNSDMISSIIGEMKYLA